MKINKLSIENFKKFKDKFDFDFSNQNFLVGENNTGKTSVIDAINYLLSGPVKDKKYKCLSCTSTDYVRVEAEIFGDFSNVDTKYQDYILSDGNGNSYMKIKRSDEAITITQSNKTIKLDESKIQCWNNTTNQFENPAGKDTTFNVIDIVSIYANDHVDDIVSFDSTKILGKLIKGSVGDFFDTQQYKDFKDQHNTVFNTGPDSLKSRLNTLASDISQILKEQWGDLELGFKFELTDNSSHLKKGSVLVKEGGIEHELEDKGSGLQRSVMLSMIQALSKVYTSNTESNIILCIDEPELNLHPKAQEKLATALSKLSDNIQVIVSTHSPYMLTSFKKDAHSVYVFKDALMANPEKLNKLSVLPFGPTLAEIQHFAYNLTPNDLHNELYGYLESEGVVSFQNSKTWIKEKRDGTIQNESVSLQEYIRHTIHHPENRRNIAFTSVEILQSIEEMIAVVNSLTP
jgi:predicted ATP-dependent endonuclease of OLD family